MLSLNPNDNQGVRFCWEDVLKGRSWEDLARQEDAERDEVLTRLNGGRPAADPVVAFEN